MDNCCTGWTPGIALVWNYWFAVERQDRAHLGSRNTVEADTHQDTGDGDLVISEFDSVKVLYTERVGRDKSVETKDQEHLSSGHQSASTLTDDAGDCIAQHSI